MGITKREAEMIADALYKKLEGKVSEIVKGITKVETEEYYCAKEVARILGWNQYTVYKKKDVLGCYVKINNRLLFPKSRLHAVIQSGRL